MFEEERNENIWLAEQMELDGWAREDVEKEEEEIDGISNILQVESGTSGRGEAG